MPAPGTAVRAALQGVVRAVGIVDGGVRSGLDVAALASEIEARAVAACPDESVEVRRLLSTLQPPSWTLEWSLPSWLGEALGVPADVSRELVISNVLGLASLRLEDDAVDGESAVGPERAARIAGALFAAAIAPYRVLFESGSTVWRDIEESTRRWRRATDLAGPAAVRRVQRSAPTVLAMARRGAPLRIGVSAVCILAGRPRLRPGLHAAVDHALAAWVLADDADDWTEDVAAGRANAFVASLVPGLDRTLSPTEVVDEVQVAMLTTDRLAAYHVRIRREADRAAGIADALIGPSPFGRHVRAFGERQEASGARLQADYHAITDRATRLMFGGALD